MAAAEQDEEEVAIPITEVLVPKPQYPNPNHTLYEKTNPIFVPLENIHSKVPNAPRSAREDLPTGVYRQAERRLEKIPCNQGIETFSEGERLRPI